MTGSIIEASKDIKLSSIQPSRSEYALRAADTQSYDFQNLVTSIKGMGLLEPLGVMPLKDGTYEVVIGSRRYEAAKLAYEKKPDTEIPCIVFKKLSAIDAKTVMAIENVHRKNLSPEEMYDLVKAYRKMGIKKQKDIAEMLHVSESYISQVITAMTGRVGEETKSLKKAYDEKVKHRKETQASKYVTARCPSCDAEITYDPSSGTFFTETAT